VVWDVVNQKYTLKIKASADPKNSAKSVNNWCIYWKLGREVVSIVNKIGSRRLRKARRFKELGYSQKFGD
jgi:3-deoxy-D-manno-octulosonic-acid transferase